MKKTTGWQKKRTWITDWGAHGEEVLVRMVWEVFFPAEDERVTIWQNLPPAIRDVVILTCQGYSNAEMAEVRGVAPSTVRTQLQFAKAAYGVASKEELRSLLAAWRIVLSWEILEPEDPAL